jgi:hypothetical protein
MTPDRKAGDTAAEDVVAALASRYRAQQIERRCRQGQRQRVTIFGAIAGDGDCAASEINFAPLQFADFAAPAASQHQQFNDAAEVVVVACFPNDGELGFAKHPGACRMPVFRIVGADNWIGLD